MGDECLECLAAVVELDDLARYVISPAACLAVPPIAEGVGADGQGTGVFDGPEDLLALRKYQAVGLEVAEAHGDGAQHFRMAWGARSAGRGWP